MQQDIIVEYKTYQPRQELYVEKLRTTNTVIRVNQFIKVEMCVLQIIINYYILVEWKAESNQKILYPLAY